MLVRRQFASLLPMLVALLLLVYMQDGFCTYRSPLLYAFLLSIPAVVQNNLWWHPDGLTLLLCVLTLFFLWRDNLSFKHNFILAAVMSGVATATKLVGAYFFLAVGLTLVLGLVLRKASWKKLLVMALAYLLVMGVSFIAANPFLLSSWQRTAYWYIFNKQAFLLAEGYGVVYETGLAAAWPLLRQYYGAALFLFVALGATLWSAIRGKQRLLHGLILAWFAPVTILVIFVTHFKFQYWLPVALPLFSSLAVLLPGKLDWPQTVSKSSWTGKVGSFAHVAALLVVMVQFGAFLRTGAQEFNAYLHRAQDNPRLLFYDKVVAALEALPNEQLSVYYDYRLYVPGQPGWVLATSYELLDYAYIQQNDFAVLLLLEQRIKDYLNPMVTGIDPEMFTLSQEFYQDAEAGTVAGYRLVYREPVGLVYVREDVYLQFLITK
jgi:hypothetical protein